ncbi:hypothetical protein AGMMS49975_08890 [Clostridia bacterium]|nr:hypothetical protein AGMMS49975_08890 [Clostridia bacterium]
MPGVARKTDTHKGICSHGAPCCPHSVTGIIIEGSPNSNANGLPVARFGDAVEHNCPHCGTGNVSSASGTVNANGKGVARLGDTVTYPGGSGTIVTASENVNVG